MLLQPQVEHALTCNVTCYGTGNVQGHNVELLSESSVLVHLPVEHAMSSAIPSEATCDLGTRSDMKHGGIAPGDVRPPDAHRLRQRA